MRLVSHLGRTGHPVAEIDVGQARLAGDVDMVEDDLRAEAVARAVGIVERVDHRQPVIEHVGQADRAQLGLAARGARPVVPVLDHAGADRRLLDHRGELEDVHVGHAAARMPHPEIAPEQRVLLLGRPGRGDLAAQMGVAHMGLALRPGGPELGGDDARGQAGRAVGAGRAVEHVLATPEPLLAQLVVERAGTRALQRGEQLPLPAPVDIGAGLRRRHVELRRQRKAVAHGLVVSNGECQTRTLAKRPFGSTVNWRAENRAPVPAVASVRIRPGG